MCISTFHGRFIGGLDYGSTPHTFLESFIYNIHTMHYAKFLRAKTLWNSQSHQTQEAWMRDVDQFLKILMYSLGKSSEGSCNKSQHSGSDEKN